MQKHYFQLIETNEVRIKVNQASGRLLSSPKITVSFSNGIRDYLDLEPHGQIARELGKCNYLGRLHNDSESSVAITGCLRKPGDIMEVTILSKNNINKMFVVDFEGNTKTIKGRFRDKGKSEIHHL